MNQIQMAPLTPVVKRLMIVTLVIWILQLIDTKMGWNFSWWLALNPGQVLTRFTAWQLVTYMFLHAMSPSHILFNGLMLWLFGSELERHWGAKFFTIYYFVCGVGAAVVYCLGVTLYAIFSGNQMPLAIPVMGASGALFGLLVAYGIIFSERGVYFMGIFPMKAKYFAIVAAALELFSLMTTGFAGTEVAYLAHLGGALVGFGFLWGHARWKLGKTKSKLKKSTASLRLVVDNEKLNKKENGPKYWN